MNTAIVCPLSSLELWTGNEDETGACGSSKTKYRDTGKSKPFRRDWIIFDLHWFPFEYSHETDLPATQP